MPNGHQIFTLRFWFARALFFFFLPFLFIFVMALVVVLRNLLDGALHDSATAVGGTALNSVPQALGSQCRNHLLPLPLDRYGFIPRPFRASCVNDLGHFGRCVVGESHRQLCSVLADPAPILQCRIVKLPILQCRIGPSVCAWQVLEIVETENMLWC